MSQLCQSLGGMKLKGSSVQCSKRLGKPVAFPTLPYLGGDHIAGSSLLALSNASLGEWDDAAIMRLFFLPFVGSYSQVSPSLCCSVFFNGILSSPRAVEFMDSG